MGYSCKYQYFVIPFLVAITVDTLVGLLPMQFSAVSVINESCYYTHGNLKGLLITVLFERVILQFSRRSLLD